MNFKIAKKDFLEALTVASKAVSSTTPLPVLSCIKIIGQNDTLTVLASDSNISIKTVLTNENNILTIEEEGEIVVDAKYLLEIIRKVDSESINIAVVDGTLIEILGGTSKYTVNGVRALDYPNISFEVSTEPFTINTEVFSDAVNKTAFACSDKETRPVLTGVNMVSKDGKLVINATDSYRLAYKTVEVENIHDFNITVPAKYLVEVSRSIGNIDSVNIAIDNQQIFFMFGNTVIKTRLLDDIFPDTSKLLPSNFTQILKVNSREMLNQLDRTSFIRGEGKSVIKLEINEGCINLTSSDSLSSFFGKMSVVSYTGDPLQISCSSKYLQDAIKAIAADVITLSFSGELKPIIITDDEDKSLIQLISPVRTYK